MLRHFDDMTIVVRDLGRAKEFFPVRGFKEVISVIIAGEPFASYMGVPDQGGSRDARPGECLAAHRDPTSEISVSVSLPDAHIRDLHKVGMNHICFAVDDVEEEVACGFKTRNAIMDFHARKLVFIDGPEGVTVELAEWQKCLHA